MANTTTTVVMRIGRDDWRYLARLQLDRELATGRKPPLTELVHEAIERLREAQ